MEIDQPRESPPHEFFETGELCESVLESFKLPDYFSALKGANLRSLQTFSSILSAETEAADEELPQPWLEEGGVNYRRGFKTWNLLLEQGINLLVYGVGSKIELISEFIEYVHDRSSYGTVRAQGYLASCSLRKILDKLMDIFVISRERAPAHKDPQYVMEYFLGELEERTRREEVEPVLLVVENLDGAALLKQETQTMLSKLAAHPLILFLATIDNPHTPLLWNLSSLESFNFLFAECPTYCPYELELSASKDPLELFPKGSKRNEIHGIQLILGSMTNAHKDILALLAQTQQAQANGAGVSLKEFFARCRDEMLVSSEKQLKEYLIEAKDHELIEQKKDRKGQVIVSFKLADEVVKLIATSQIYASR